jgi:DNA-binding XRE family transcriptional regulator
VANANPGNRSQESESGNPIKSNGENMRASKYRDVRESIGSQSSVAKQLGVDVMTISRRERGVYTIGKEAQLALVYLKDKKKKKGDQ